MIRKENVNIIYNNVTEVEFTLVLLLHHVLRGLQIYLRYVEKRFCYLYLGHLSVTSKSHFFAHLNYSKAKNCYNNLIFYLQLKLFVPQ